VQQPPEQETTQLFLALLPGADVLAALAQHADQWRWGVKAARYAPQDWHITLHFLGPVPRDRLDEVRAGVAVPVQPFELQFGQAALWPHGLAVLCPEAVPEGLQQLHDRLRQALQRLGLKTDTRPLRPHITLARHARDAVLPLQRPLFGWPVAGYALMASTAKAPQRYRVVQQYGSAAST
jgi:2'-5' RNA ligase